MIAVVTSVVLPLLFAGSGTFGAVVLVASWRRHAGAFARLRAELAASRDAEVVPTGPVCEVRIRTTAVAPRRIVRPVRTAAASRPAAAGQRVAA